MAIVKADVPLVSELDEINVLPTESGPIYKPNLFYAFSTIDLNCPF
jgi:hypothetical protein